MQIFVHGNQQELGPYSKAFVQECLATGAFSAQDYARTEGMSEYKPLGELLIELEEAAPQKTPVQAMARPVATGRPVVGQRPKAMPRIAMPPKKRPPILSGAFVIALVAAGAYVAFSPGATGIRSYLVSVAQGSNRATKTQVRLATPAPLPVAPVITEAPKPPPPAEPEPEPEVEPTPPQPPPFDPAKLAENPAAWPKAVRLLENVEFPAVLDGRAVGTLRVLAGTPVKLVKISGQNLTVDFRGGQVALPWTKTNLDEAAAEVAMMAAANPSPAPAAATTVAGPAATPSGSSWMWKNSGPNYGDVRVDPSSIPEANALDRALLNSKFQLTPEVGKAYLRFSKAKALREIKNSQSLLPADFLTWIDSDPIIQTTVYGSRQNAAGVLCILRSLELDLGSDAVRRDYTQLALAMAVTEAANGATADLSRRQPLKLTIPGDPRKPVNTHAKDRQLDVNDHIINFLEDHAPIDGDTFGPNERPPELKYDSKGVAILDRDKVSKGTTDSTVKRPVVAADVLERKDLQDEFNAYMAKHGQKVRIDCGDHEIFPNRHEAIKGPYAAKIKEAYQLFRGAYEAKGRLPASRDPFPTPAERCAFIIRNDSLFPESKEAHKKWDRFPVKTAPWPTMTLLAEYNDPLREREEMWQRFVDKGETVLYGEYIDGIAQQFDFQSARRLSPYPFTYGTFQMMFKDGGVCGTMANMSVRTHNSLGTPSCTAGQPGHCALILFGLDKNGHFYKCYGGQYATGGDDKTHPHANWIFGDTDSRRDMAWHQSVAYGVNAGFQSYLDSMVALQIYKYLPSAKQKEKGLALLQSGLALNRYNIALVEAAVESRDANNGLNEFGAFLKKSLQEHGDVPSCPSKGLYNTTVQELLAKHGATMDAEGNGSRSQL